ncbi:hypothetical protein AX15_001953 [Amanita polypyramis BW_CC]|nr:hypothetical protein AX15_001953 [Amanita polypyramis BW_CC]
MAVTETPTAIHHALFCSEIFQLICEQCNKSTLASLARIKRDLTEPVLDILWREITGIGPLVRCMPPDLWDEDGAAMLALCRAIIPTDWNRFDANAARVRKFGFPDDSVTKYIVGSRVYGALSCAAIDRKVPPLPKLTDIYWAPDDADVFFYIHLFLSPSIQNAVIGLTETSSFSDEPYEIRLSVIPPLASVCPAITHFTINGSEDSDDPSWESCSTALSTMKRWPSLWHLTLRNLPDASIYCIAELPRLRELIVEEERIVGEMVGEMDEPPPITKKGFPMLQTLDLQISHIGFCTTLVNCMSRTPLRSLHLNLCGDPIKEYWTKLFNAIRLCIDHNSLRVIHIDYDDVDALSEDQPEDPPIILSDLSPLLAFTYLSKVSITARFGFDLDNKDLKTIISAWSHLQTLEIIPVRPSEHWPQINLEGLVIIARQCPSLESLTIAFDASEGYENVEKPGGGACNEKLRTLGVLHSPIGDPPKVAAFLSDIFPNLRSIFLYEHEDKEVPVGFEELQQKWEQKISCFSLNLYFYAVFLQRQASCSYRVFSVNRLSSIMVQRRQAIQISFENLARVDGSARFAFGKTATLASVSGPIEARLSAENPSQATFDVHLRPISGVPATNARALASSVRSALLPSLILTHHPRTLIQLVLQTLSSPAYSQSYWLQQAQTKMTPANIGSDHALAAALVNASTLALLSAGSVPMRGTVIAAPVGLSSTGELILGPVEDQLSDLIASGCFAFLFADEDAQCVWTSWKIVPTSNTGGVGEDIITQARDLARTEARGIRDEIKHQIINMGKKEQTRIPSAPIKRENVPEDNAMQTEEDDDDKMEI